MAGHVEAGYEFKDHRRKPFGEAGYVWFSRDYTPVATGFSDWGKWYPGNQIDWIIFGHNTRIVRASALSNEFSYIAQWTPHKKFWMDVVVGDSPRLWETGDPWES